MITKDELRKRYIDWLKEEITITEIGKTFEITSPFLDRFNDYLQIYVTPMDNENLQLSDDSYIINNLISSGVDLSSKRRKEFLNSITKKFGIEKKENELTVKCTLNDFPKKKHLLAQAMLTIDDMFMLSQNRIASLFLDDLIEFFNKKEIFYTENVSFIGKTGYAFQYDFVLQRSKNHPERLCKAINNMSKSNVESILFAWSDTRETRHEDTQLIVIANDANNINENEVNALTNYDAKVIKFSEINKDENMKMLA